MIAVDTNLLVYAHRRDSPWHGATAAAVTRLAEGLKRPENFCGMHFINPVHKMPLVEVIRGAKSSDNAVATTVGYALSMGKTPIVVGDCPGFLVNRVLFPYFAGFMMLVNEGVEFQRIDKAMEKFGWPMGPAFLLDVVGIDTAYHASAVMAKGFPDRMAATERTALEVMYDDPTIRADVTTATLKVGAEGLTTTLYGTHHAYYPYGEQLLVYDFERSTVIPLPDAHSARNYFAETGVGSASRCQTGWAGTGVPVLPVDVWFRQLERTYFSR